MTRRVKPLKSLTLRIHPAQLAPIRTMARRDGRSLNSWICKAIREKWARDKLKEQESKKESKK